MLTGRNVTDFGNELDIANVKKKKKDDDDVDL
jgi:hypothetical protein